MGIGCVLSLWAAVALIAALAALVGVVLFFCGWRPLGALLAVIGIAAAFSATAFIALWIWAAAHPQREDGPAAFRVEFGSEPDADANVRAELTQSTDFQQRLMRFRASPSTIAHITRTKFKRAPLTACSERLDRAPEWWAPRGTACYEADPYDDAFASNHAWLLYDKRSRDAHFVYSGVD